MTKEMRRTLLAVIGTLFAVLVTAQWHHIEVRHSAPYGFSKTIDFSRLIAVPGGYVTANYSGFNRVEIDLRAYSDEATYDLTLHIRPALPGAGDVRTIHMDVRGAEVFNTKAALEDPFMTINFEPIANSAGQTYYVWVERGPRNQDQVITVWSIKSYSSVPFRTVVSSMVSRIVRQWGFGWLQAVTWLSVCGATIAAAIAVWRLVFIGFTAQNQVFGVSALQWQGRTRDGIQ